MNDLIYNRSINVVSLTIYIFYFVQIVTPKATTDFSMSRSKKRGHYHHDADNITPLSEIINNTRIRSGPVPIMSSNMKSS